MAVYQGARRREGFLPGRAAPLVPLAAAAPAPALPRRRARTAVRAGRRTNRVGVILGGIVLAFMLAFFSLAQSVRVSATGYDLAAVQAENDRLQATRQDLLTNIYRLGSAPAIRKLALDRGLGPLAAPLIVPAR